MKPVNPRRRAAVIAVSGTALGAAGLGVLAVPAGAGEAPELPAVEPLALVELVLRSDAPALSGSITVDNELGLPKIDGMSAVTAESGRVYFDGEGRARLALELHGGEYTVVNDGTQVWSYDSEENIATRLSLPDHDADMESPHGAVPSDPATMARRLVEFAGETSTVSVDGTATVAGRAAYELVLTPKPTEKTLLREARIAVDAENRLPLRVSVFTHGTAEPVVSLGFTEIDFGGQAPDLFSFTPPAGAEVTDIESRARNRGEKPFDDAHVVGEGWDSVMVARVAADTRSELADARTRDLLSRIGTRVNGDYGEGYLVKTRAVTALLTDDGRIAVGAVPEQVLSDALSRSGR
ncbi:outer membrane lipoprotein carrier protein LolA [Saccharomonospora xinjiangensis]|uniref:LolA family protein n=1 Tax=Saccharomonospora xinjiangensis TaxID=75294 RepID=UPI00106F1A63|nr:outer membrane lipoprotein carrier protein LolA [Saccharomonospora xinjiangensis]QBQ61808.1 hypothetical protein EYD13_17320 [Saccharomonospora xinjiangensis]